MKRLKPQTVPYSHIQMAMNMARENENLTLKPYHDTVDKLTVGYGRNLEDRGLTMAEAELLLANDVIEAHEELHTQLAFYKELSEIRQAVLMDLYHNMGLSGLLGFRNMLENLRNSQWDEAAEDLKDSRYWDQVGARAKRNYLMIRFDKPFSRQETESYFTNGFEGKETGRSRGI